MKKLLSIAASLALLGSLCALPASAASVPSLSQWHAIQDEVAPNRTIATAQKGRLTVTSDFKSNKEPGGCAVICEVPVDLSDFEVTFSLDKYTPCADQYLGIGFSSAPLTDSLYADSEHPGFMLMLRPSDQPNTIVCAEGLVNNWDTRLKMIRVGKSSYDPGHYFEGTAEASWTNVKFSVKRNSTDDGYDVFINDKRINNENKWSFVDDIAAATDGKWYLQMVFKDGNYAPAAFTIKTINGAAAVEESADGTAPGSYSESEPTDPPATSEPESTDPNSGDESAAESTPDESDSSGSSSKPAEESSAAGTGSSGGDTASTGGEPDGSGGLSGGVIALIVVGVVVVLAGAGVAVYFLVIKKKKA